MVGLVTPRDANASQKLSHSRCVYAAITGRMALATFGTQHEYGRS